MRKSVLVVLVLISARPATADDASVAAAAKLTSITVTVRMSSCESPTKDQTNPAVESGAGPLGDWWGLCDWW